MFGALDSESRGSVRILTGVVVRGLDQDNCLFTARLSTSVKKKGLWEIIGQIRKNC